MFIPYYSPNISPGKIVNSLCAAKFEKKVIRYFQELTGKKHILLTASCRTALYLTYRSLKKTKAVITSPLTCTSGLSPIIEAGKELYYCDIDEKTLVMDPDLLLKNEGCDVVVQVIHLGGYPVDVQVIKKKGYFVIEDCAQALGSRRDQRSVGYFGDVACFSLVKTGYGVGGGILATDDEELYAAAKGEQESWEGFARTKLWFRILRSCLESRQRNRLLRAALVGLLALTKKKRVAGQLDFMGVLNKPAAFFFRVFSVQLKRLGHYHDVRRACAANIAAKLDGQSWRRQLGGDGDGTKVVQSKFFIHSASIATERVLPALATAGIDAKHLEQRSDSRLQLRLDRDSRFNRHFSAAELPRYLRIHDHLLSLPLNEDLSEREIDHITKTLNSIDRIEPRQHGKKQENID